MLFGEQMEAALDACYESIANPDYWSESLERLSIASGAAAAMFYPKDANEGAGEQPMSPAYREFIADYVKGGWYEDHYRAERGWPLLQGKPAAVILEHDLATDEERKKLPHYNDLYLKWGFKGFAAVGFELEDEKWCVPFLRREKQGFFNRQEGSRLAALAPHFRKMVFLSQRLALASARGGIDALTLLDRPAILIDWAGKIIEINSAAQRVLDRPDNGLFIRNGRLLAQHGESNNRLQDVLSPSRARFHRQQRLAETRSVRIDRSGGRPLIIDISSIRSLITPLSSRALALLLINDPDLRISPKADRLQEWLSLSPAEAKLALLLWQGQNLSEAAEELGITRETARDRLKSIFGKTDTHRQGELISLMGRYLS